MECLREIRPEASPQHLTQLLDQSMTLTDVTSHGERALTVRLLEIFKTYVPPKLKPGDGGAEERNGFCSDAVMERALG